MRNALRYMVRMVGLEPTRLFGAQDKQSYRILNKVNGLRW